MRYLAVTIASLTGTAQVLSFVQRPYHAALIGSGRQATFNLITSGRTLATTALAFFLLSRQGVVAIPIAEVILQCAAFFVFMVVFRHLEIARQSTPVAPDGETTRRLMRFGGLVSLGGFAWMIEATSDTIILANIAGPEAVAAYALWWRFPQMIFTLCTQLTASAFPEFAHQAGASPERARLLFQKLAYLVAGLATLALVGIGLWLPSFVRIWLGGGYALPDGRGVAVAMATLVFLRVMGNLFSMFWMATRGAGLPAQVSIIQASVKVILALVVAHLGILWLIVASCVAAAIQGACLGIALLTVRQLHLSYILRSGAMTMVALVACVAGGQLLVVQGPALLVLGTTATAGIWMILWVVVVQRSEISPMLNQLAICWFRRLQNLAYGA